jgi:RimJ/RimL family protein N-acetyltransferase
MSLPEEMRSERLRLRPSTVADAAAVFSAWAGDARSCRWLEWEPHRSRDATAALLHELEGDRASGAACDWIAEGLGDGSLVGAARLAWHSAIERDLGFIVARDRRGEGHATELVSLVTDAALALPEVVRVQASCHPDNAASLRVLEKSGYEREGRLRRCRIFPNLGPEPQDLLIFSRLA